MTRFVPRSIHRLIADVLQHDRKRIVAMIALALTAALVESFGILSLVPVAALAVSPDAMADVPLIGALLAGLAPGQRLPAALLAFVALMAIRAVILNARARAQAALVAHYDASLKLRAIASLARRPWSQASQIGRDGMQSLLHNDVPRAGASLSFAIQLLVVLILLTVQIALAAWLSLPMTLAALALILAGVPLGRIYFRRAHRSGESISARLEASSAHGNRLHDELKSAMAQASVGLFLDRYRSSLDALCEDHVRFGQDQANVSALSGLAAAIAAALLVWAGVGVLRLELPLVLGLLLLFSRMSAPAQSLISLSNALAAYSPSFTAIVDRLGPLAPVPRQQAAKLPTPLAWSRLELRAVTLVLGARPVLDRVDLTLDAGEWLAIEGASGAGKTSLLDLIAGLHRPASGDLLVDGAPLEGARLASWQRMLSYVGQDEMIYAASLRDNLGAGVAEIDPVLLERALWVSGLDALVATWPEGLDLPLADRGRRLSGGERQRVGIARALLRAPRLMILDEATAALDLGSERTLFDRLRSLDNPPAILLVSHRPQTLARCDRQLKIADARALPAIGRF